MDWVCSLHNGNEVWGILLENMYLEEWKQDEKNVSKDAGKMWTGLDWINMVSKDKFLCSGKFIYIVVFIFEIQPPCKKLDNNFCIFFIKVSIKNKTTTEIRAVFNY
jgi:hypothetical protein